MAAVSGDNLRNHLPGIGKMVLVRLLRQAPPRPQVPLQRSGDGLEAEEKGHDGGGERLALPPWANRALAAGVPKNGISRRITEKSGRRLGKEQVRLLTTK